MRLNRVFFAVAIILIGPGAVPAAEKKPAHISSSIWVREDIFAGFLGNDMERFSLGEQKADALIAADPNDLDALAWKASAGYFRAVRAFEAGDRAEFDKLYAKATADFENLAKRDPQNIAALAIAGGVVSTLGHRLPPELQAAANRWSVEKFLALEALQKPYFDKMPVHHRGEVLAGIAQGAARSSQDELSRTYLKRIVESLGGTAYASVAQKMLDRPELARNARVACNSCHEPNRLENQLKAAAASKAR